jgi:PKD repeat protein
MQFGRLRLSLLIFVLATAFAHLTVCAQNFTGIPVQVQNSAKISERYVKWEVYRLNADAMHYFLQDEPNEPVYLHLGNQHFGMQLQYNDMFDDNFKLVYQTDQGDFPLRTTVRPYKGVNTADNSPVRLTMDEDFIYGSIRSAGEVYYIQPLWYVDPSFDKDLYLVYNRKDVITTGLDLGCGTDHDHHEDPLHEDIDQKIEEKIQADNGASACYQVDLAIASDASMLSKYGNAGAVQAHNIGVLNNVEGDYTGAFNHDITFNIVIQIVSNTNPWGATSVAGNYLANFRNWGNNGGFGVSYDLAELWTNIDLDGSTIGIAYLTAVCTPNRYHVLQDFSSDADLLRVLTSHEIGHNFAASHDNCPSGGTLYIMCPFVSTSTQWSAASVNSISSHITSRINNGCLQLCSSGPPPTPDFSWSPEPACVNQSVAFTDESIGTVNTYNWTFPGGIPATSTSANPTVTWPTPGVKNVTLVLNNGSASQASIAKPVTVLGIPTASFTQIVNGLTVSFNATVTGATSVLWDFGDGNSSTQEDPVYTYSDGNTYVVTLTVEGPCGTIVRTANVNTAPVADFSVSETVGCAPFTVNFANNSSPNAVTYLWQFPGGIPSSSQQVNPVVVYQTPGVYSVTLTAFNSVGSSVATYNNFIVVNTVPSANFTYTVNGLTVNFTSTTNTGTSYVWEFGNGATSDEQNPVYTYPTGGNYTVLLTIYNDCNSTTVTKVVNLALPPTASFTASPSTGCGPLTVNFSSTSVNATGLQWSFPGGSPATATVPNPVVVYTNPGTYTATLTATNAAGPNTATQTITVQTVPNPSFSSSVNNAVVNFTNTTANATSYFWDFGDGNNSTSANPQHTYAADGTYQVVLNALNACGTSTIAQTVTIVTPPVANFSASVTSGCAPLTVQFSNTASANATGFAWQFPGGSPSSSTNANPVVTYATPGQYNVILTVSNAAGSNTATQNSYITVNSAPAAAFTQSVNGLQATFTSTSTGGATTYSWVASNNTTSNQPNFTTTFAAAGTYTVTLTAGNACGTSTAVQTVTIVEAPTASFTATPTTGCNTLNVQFTNTSAGNPTAFSWQFPGGTPSSSTDANPVVVYSTPGTYNVVLTASNGAGSGSITQTAFINVGVAPVAGFTSTTTNTSVAFTNSSANATTYSWAFGDGNSSSQANPVHTYVNDGVYTVVLTATNACGTSTSTQVVSIVSPPTAGFTVSSSNGCAPFVVTMNNTSSANATSFVWQFPGGNPASSTEANPVVTYNAPGTYNITLTATNAAGSTTTAQTNAVTVGSGPTSSFMVNQNGASVSFTNTSSGATAYSWAFGDGSIATGANTSHLYLNDGVYTVVLTSSNACGTSTSSQVVTIVTPPVANMSATNNVGCAPLTVQFNNSSTPNATSFNWLFPGGTPASSTEANPVVVYETPGLYSVILTASNAQGASTVTQTNFVTAVGDPVANFTTDTLGTEVTFTSTSTGATSFLWHFGDGNTSTESDPIHNYATDGVFEVVLIAGNTCGADTITRPVTVIIPPLANFGANTITGCAPLSVTFTNTSTPNATNFVWLFPGGTPSTSTEANPTVVYDAAGVYDVSLTASNSAGSSVVTKLSYIGVNGLPSPLFTYQLGGLSAQFNNASFNATSYAWNFGDGGSSTAVNPVHNYSTPGTYTVEMIATNDCGSRNYITEVVIEGTAPIADFSGGEQLTGCAPFEVQFADLSVGQPTTWEWSFVLNGDVIDTAKTQNPLVVFNEPGVYDVSLTVTNTFGANTVTKLLYVTVNAAPTAAFAPTVGINGQVTFTNNSQNAQVYSWNFGDNSPASSEVNPTHTYTESGSYNVVLSAINECGVSVFQTTVNVDVSGVEDVNWVEKFRLFPNPNTGAFQLEMEGTGSDELQFDLFSTEGKLIRTDRLNFSTGSLKHRFDYGALPTGVYAFRISDARTSFVVRVTITR